MAPPVPAPRLFLHFPSNLGGAGAGLAATLTRDSNRPKTALKITVMSPTEGTQVGSLLCSDDPDPCCGVSIAGGEEGFMKNLLG